MMVIRNCSLKQHDSFSCFFLCLFADIIRYLKTGRAYTYLTQDLWCIVQNTAVHYLLSDRQDYF